MSSQFSVRMKRAIDLFVYTKLTVYVYAKHYRCDTERMREYGECSVMCCCVIQKSFVCLLSLFVLFIFVCNFTPICLPCLLFQHFCVLTSLSLSILSTNFFYFFIVRFLQRKLFAFVSIHSLYPCAKKVAD